MRYLLLIYSNSENWEHPMYLRDPRFLALPEADRERLTRQADELFEEITASGEFVVGNALADPVRSRSVRPHDGAPAVTDGPFVEAKEQLAGYFVLDCETPERAAEIASRFPDALLTGIELRPIMETSGQEM